MQLEPVVFVLILVAAALVAGALGVFIGITIRKNTAEKEIGGAEEEARRIVSDAIKNAEAKKKELVLEGKEEVHRFRNESEKEIADRRREVQRQERRIQQKEETLDRKLDNVEKKEEKAAKKNKKLTKSWKRLKPSRKASLRCSKKFRAIPPSRQRITYSPNWKTS